MLPEQEDGFICICLKSSYLLSIQDLINEGERQNDLSSIYSTKEFIVIMLVVKDVIVIILWVSSIISGVQCCNYKWGMYVGPQSVSHMNLCDKQLQDAPVCEGRLSPLSGTLAVSPRPAGTDETNQNSFAESSISFCLI